MSNDTLIYALSEQSNITELIFQFLPFSTRTTNYEPSTTVWLIYMGYGNKKTKIL